MKILFTHSYFLYFDPKQVQASTPYPPLGTIYAAAYLREKGYDVFFKDIQFSKDAGEIEKELKEIKPDVFVNCSVAIVNISKLTKPKII